MTGQSVPKKLRLHTVQRGLVLNAPQGYFDALAELPKGLQLDQQAAGTYPFVHLFVKDSEELLALIDSALRAIEHDALFWISYPKGRSGVETDLNRDSLWQVMLAKGFRPVTQVAVDKVWSALRFRPAEAVGT